MARIEILIIDDDADTREFLSHTFEKEGFNVHEAPSAKATLKRVEKHKPDLILLDIMMPDMDGIELCEVLRRDDELDKIPIVFLTARNEDYSQIAGFKAGADDYITKPVNPKVLIKRIKAILKRHINHNINTSLLPEIEKKKNIIGTNEVYIDKDKFAFISNKEQIELPKKEFELLEMLMAKPERVFTREEIYPAIWKKPFSKDRTIDVHIRKLRKKIGSKHIVTIKGLGYKFVY